MRASPRTVGFWQQWPWIRRSTTAPRWLWTPLTYRFGHGGWICLSTRWLWRFRSGVVSLAILGALATPALAQEPGSVYAEALAAPRPAPEAGDQFPWLGGVSPYAELIAVQANGGTVIAAGGPFRVMWEMGIPVGSTTPDMLSSYTITIDGTPRPIVTLPTPITGTITHVEPAPGVTAGAHTLTVIVCNDVGLCSQPSASVPFEARPRPAIVIPRVERP